MIEVRPANQKDVRDFHNGDPIYSFRGIVVLEDDKPIALAGIYGYAGKRIIFSELKDEARKYRKTTLKIAKEYLASVKGELYAFCSETETTAPRFLEHLGFYKVTPMIYRRD